MQRLGINRALLFDTETMNASYIHGKLLLRIRAYFYNIQPTPPASSHVCVRIRFNRMDGRALMGAIIAPESRPCVNTQYVILINNTYMSYVIATPNVFHHVQLRTEVGTHTDETLSTASSLAGSIQFESHTTFIFSEHHGTLHETDRLPVRRPNEK